MIEFELDVSNKQLIVYSGLFRKHKEVLPIAKDITTQCINILKGKVYITVNQLVSNRENIYAHIVYVNKDTKCDSILQKNEIAYKSPDWMDKYLSLLQYDLNGIAPRSDSRYYANFRKKCTELIDTLLFYKSGKPMYRIVNIAKQERLNFV